MDFLARHSSVKMRGNELLLCFAKVYLSKHSRTLAFSTIAIEVCDTPNKFSQPSLTLFSAVGLALLCLALWIDRLAPSQAPNDLATPWKQSHG